MRARAAAVVALACVACSPSELVTPNADPHADPAEVEARLRATLDALAELGEKRAGTEAGARAGDYLAARFESAGLADVHFEPFDFLQYRVESARVAVVVDGAEVPMASDVFAYGGEGNVSAEVVDVGTGHEADYEAVDVTGKVVLVTRDATFHRSSQYRLVVEHGGAAMLYVSQSPDNLIQIGTVADPEDGLAPIPAVTVGADDGQIVKDGLAAGADVVAQIQVQASTAAATGRNVVGRLAGTRADGAYLLLGAHYDTWYAGAADNGTGVAALVEVAEAMAARPDRQLSLVFVGYDGEELGLFGGYDYLRDHVVVGDEPVLAFVNFEMPAAGEVGLRALAHTNGGPIGPGLDEVSLSSLYVLTVGMEVVPSLFGGIIPTDIQGMYWSGLQGLTTACDSPYYHTPEDTPDKLDIGFLARAVLAFEDALDTWDEAPPEQFRVHDPLVWDIAASVEDDPAGAVIEVLVKDASGAAQADAAVRVWLDVDDFTRVFDVEAKADADGRARVTIPREALDRGRGERWVHVTAGERRPLAERIVPLP